MPFRINKVQYDIHDRDDFPWFMGFFLIMSFDRVFTRCIKCAKYSTWTKTFFVTFFNFQKWFISSYYHYCLSRTTSGSKPLIESYRFVFVELEIINFFNASFRWKAAELLKLPWWFCFLFYLYRNCHMLCSFSCAVDFNFSKWWNFFCKQITKHFTARFRS